MGTNFNGPLPLDGLPNQPLPHRLLPAVEFILHAGFVPMGIQRNGCLATGTTLAEFARNAGHTTATAEGARSPIDEQDCADEVAAACSGTVAVTTTRLAGYAYTACVYVRPHWAAQKTQPPGALVAQRPTTAPVRYLVAIGPGGVAWASAPAHGDRGLRAALGHALPTSPDPAAAGPANH